MSYISQVYMPEVRKSHAIPANDQRAHMAMVQVYIRSVKA